MFEGFGLSDAPIRIAQRIFDQLANTDADPRISFLPMTVIFPALRRERNVHSSSLIFFRITLPRLIASSDRRRRLAFAGERMR